MTGKWCAISFKAGRLVLCGALALLITVGYPLRVVDARPEGARPVPPDLTQYDVMRTLDRTATANLGATGMRGWIYSKPASRLDNMQGRKTDLSRQILVTHIGTNSPACGVMKIDDVILGVDGARFQSDARKGIARAIQQSEMDENSGILTLLVWRWNDGVEEGTETPRQGLAAAGKIIDVTLKLKVMGRYSDTAPYNCPKSEKILADACKVLEREMFEDLPNIWPSVSALALMATGQEAYMPRVKAYARSLAERELLREGGGSWDCAYPNLFLSEYYLLTGDKAVLPAIKVLTLKLARGQSMYGTFGHAFSLRTPEGALHGPVGAYGPVHQAGLIANIAIIMGKKCGVGDPVIDAAIARASNYFAYYVDKGGIPYGEHTPFMCHGGNGKHAMAALFFSLQEGKAREARYYTKLVTASYNNREYGHTGQGFSYLWGALGAGVGGPDAVSALFSRTSWHTDLSRRSDGSFVYTGIAGRVVAALIGDSYFGKSHYYGMSTTAAYVLTLSLPRRNLYITGKNPNKAYWLSKDDIDAAIASGNLDQTRKDMSLDELVEALDDWSPIARSWIAEELASRPDVQQRVPLLMDIAKAAKGAPARQSQGAVETLGLLQSKKALPVFTQLLTHEDRWLRYQAAEAIKRLGEDARPAIDTLLDTLVMNAEPITPIGWDDPIQFAQGKLADVVFHNLLQDSLDGVDRDRLYPAIKTVLQTPDGYARSRLARTFRNALTLEDVEKLGAYLLETMTSPGPANAMSADGIRHATLQVLAKYRFREGMQLCFETIDLNSWGKQRRIGNWLKALASYGGAAKEVLPMLDSLEQDLLSHREAKALERHIKYLREVRDVIKKDKNPEPVRDLL